MRSGLVHDCLDAGLITDSLFAGLRMGCLESGLALSSATDRDEAVGLLGLLGSGLARLLL